MDTLGEYVEIINGGTPKTSNPSFWNGDIPWISIKDFSNKYIDNTEKTITEDGLRNSSTSLLNSGDIIISARGTVGKLAVLKKPMAFNQSCFGIRTKSNLLRQDYLYYLLLNKFQLLQQLSHGSVFSTITRDTLNNLEIQVPPVEIQARIADLLSSIDDKIEVNIHVNDNLQEQAFLHFNKLLQGKEADTCLSDYVCLNPNRQLPKGKIARCIDMSKLSTSGTFPSGWEYKEYNGGMKFCNGDTILARITPCLENGKTALINFLDSDEVAFGSTEYIVLSPKFSHVSPGFVYCLSRYTPFVDYAVKNMNGSSGRQRVSAETISQFSLPVISEKEFETFGKTTNPLFQLMLCNSIESLRLARMRDELLPRLLRGDIEIN